MTDLTQVRRRAISACEAEAVAWEYPSESGREIFEGICRDRIVASSPGGPHGQSNFLVSHY